MPPQRNRTAVMQHRTEKRIEQFDGKRALLETWEKKSDEVQIKNHDYIIGLRARVRQIKNYLEHRADFGVPV